MGQNQCNNPYIPDLSAEHVSNGILIYDKMFCGADHSATRTCDYFAKSGTVNLIASLTQVYRKDQAMINDLRKDMYPPCSFLHELFDIYERNECNAYLILKNGGNRHTGILVYFMLVIHEEYFWTKL